jgi:hypothetical protein
MPNYLELHLPERFCDQILFISLSIWRQGLEEDTCTKKNVKEGKPVADQRDFSTMRYVRNLAFIANIAAEVESDRHVTVRKLARVHGMSTDRSCQAA